MSPFAPELHQRSIVLRCTLSSSSFICLRDCTKLLRRSLWNLLGITLHDCELQNHKIESKFATYSVVEHGRRKEDCVSAIHINDLAPITSFTSTKPTAHKAKEQTLRTFSKLHNPSSQIGHCLSNRISQMHTYRCMCRRSRCRLWINQISLFKRKFLMYYIDGKIRKVLYKGVISLFCVRNCTAFAAKFSLM